MCTYTDASISFLHHQWLGDGSLLVACELPFASQLTCHCLRNQCCRVFIFQIDNCNKMTGEWHLCYHTDWICDHAQQRRKIYSRPYALPPSLWCMWHACAGIIFQNPERSSAKLANWVTGCFGQAFELLGEAVFRWTEVSRQKQKALLVDRCFMLTLAEGLPSDLGYDDMDFFAGAPLPHSSISIFLAGIQFFWHCALLACC